MPLSTGLDHRRRLRVALVVCAYLLGACSAAPHAGSPLPGTSPTPTASVDERPSATPSPFPSPTPTPTTPPRPTPSASQDVAAAPSGPWSRIAWVDAGDVVPLGPRSVTVHGWSGGYFALEQNRGVDGDGAEAPVVIHASGSTNGLRWSKATTLDTSGFTDAIDIEKIIEGPAGLLAMGYVFGVTCSGPPVVVALWSSTDGRAWSRLTMPKAFKTNEVHHISGGSAGFIATGTRADGTTEAIWTSLDGRNWTDRPVPQLSSGDVLIDGGASFAGGFVVVGGVIGEDGCGGPARAHAGTWWSADGAAWTRASLPGSSTDPDAVLTIVRISDRVIVATQSALNGSHFLAWTSSDGRTWSAVSKPSRILTREPVSDGRHAAHMIDPESGVGAPSFERIDEDGQLVRLLQSGHGPMENLDGLGETFAVGPTGIVAVRYDGGSAWLGLPS